MTHPTLQDWNSPGRRRATGATRLIQGSGRSRLIFHHSHRVFLFGAISPSDAGVAVDPELPYLAALFHDAALAMPFADWTQRLQLDGADFARCFMVELGFSTEAQDTVWTSIALPHDARRFPCAWDMRSPPLRTAFSSTRSGWGWRRWTPHPSRRSTRLHLRDHFKRGSSRPSSKGYATYRTTYGTVYNDALQHVVPGFGRTGMVDRITGSAWPS